MEVLEYSKYKGYLDSYRKSNKTEEDYKKDRLETIYQAAKWSLKSNCSQHSFLMSIVTILMSIVTIYKNEDLPVNAITELKEVLGK